MSKSDKTAAPVESPELEAAWKLAITLDQKGERCALDELERGLVAFAKAYKPFPPKPEPIETKLP